MNDWERFNGQFAEDADEKRERMRKAVVAARCPCGGNDKIGKPHTIDCSRVKP